MISGLAGQSSQAAYGPAKFVASGLTKHLAVELAPRRIRVNAVAPGTIRTEAVAALPDDYVEPMRAAHPMGRLGEPGEVAEAICFLASDAPPSSPARSSPSTAATWLVEEVASLPPDNAPVAFTFRPLLEQGDARSSCDADLKSAARQSVMILRFGLVEVTEEFEPSVVWIGVSIESDERGMGYTRCCDRSPHRAVAVPLRKNLKRLSRGGRAVPGSV